MSHCATLLCGPTAIGKTTLSLAVSRGMNGEIISADARQIYRGLDIGTAKPSADELAAVPHHFIDELDPHESFSAGQFARAAEARMRQTMDRGHTPLVVGGSTLYIDALVNGFAEIPDVDPTIRDSLNRRLTQQGSETLFAELREVDPQAAATMDPTKSQRIVRALEVYHGTGRPLSHYHGNRRKPAFTYRGVILERKREDLYERINRRVNKMLEAGLVDEVRGLLDRGVDPECNSLRTIGYREVVAYLRNEYPKEEMVRLLKRNTRRYAKRQITWFKRYTQFVRVHADTPVHELLEVLGPPA